jgi:hypothetical protein
MAYHKQRLYEQWQVSIAVVVLLFASAASVQSQNDYPHLKEGLQQIMKSSGQDVHLATREEIGKISGPGILSEVGPNCGANCLYVFAKLLHADVERSSLLENVPVTGEGANMQDLKIEARNLGVHAKVVSLSPGKIAPVHLPAIAQLSTGVALNHFIVLLSIEDGFVNAIDGTSGSTIMLSRSDFERDFQGNLLIPDRNLSVHRLCAALKTTLFAESCVCVGLVSVLIYRRFSS